MTRLSDEQIDEAQECMIAWTSSNANDAATIMQICAQAKLANSAGEAVAVIVAPNSEIPYKHLERIRSLDPYPIGATLYAHPPVAKETERLGAERVRELCLQASKLNKHPMWIEACEYLGKALGGGK
jgi:hypothetical protein